MSRSDAAAEVDGVGFLLPQVGPDPAEVAVRAEELGYDSVWLGELWYTAAPVKLAEIVERTEAVEVGAAILNVYSRTPATLAMTAATLQRDSGGRFTLGLGTSTRKSIEDLHGLSFDDPNPARRAHECIELVREFLEGGGRVDYDGQVFHAADFPALGSRVPLYGAALGPANRRVVARLCDGWIPHNVPFPALPEAFDYIREHIPRTVTPRTSRSRRTSPRRSTRTPPRPGTPSAATSPTTSATARATAGPSPTGFRTGPTPSPRRGGRASARPPARPSRTRWSRRSAWRGRPRPPADSSPTSARWTCWTGRS